MVSRRFVSPLRYPGGKGWLAHKIDFNGIRSDCLVEPYAGGGAVALWSLSTGIVREIWLNDLDYRVFAFWKSVVYENDRFCKKILDTPATIDEWHKQKNISINATRHDDIFDLGFSAFFLNRTNYCGVLGSSPVGGLAQNGKYRLDARYNRENLAKRVSEIGKAASRIRITNLAASDLLDCEMSEHSIIYLDPPYVHKKGLYMEARNDFAEVSRKLRKLDVPWFMTIDDDKIVFENYLWAEKRTFSMKYSFLHSSERKKGMEWLVWANMDFPLQETKNPGKFRD